MKILVVEDQEDDRRLLKSNFIHNKCDVLEASNGLEALEIAERESPDLIISDILMPKMDGFELLWTLKNQEKTRNIPFIFYSAIYTGERDMELALSLGAETFIEKPKEPIELFSKILQVIKDCSEKKSIRQPDMDNLMKEKEFLKSYSQIVAAKLDEKVRELSLLNEKYTRLYNEYKTLIDAIPDVICLMDSNLRILWVNKSFEAKFKRDPEEVHGKICHILFHNREEPCESCPVSRAFRSGNTEFEEKKMIDGTIFDVRAVPIRDESGNITNVIEIIRDITEERKTQEQLIHAQRMEDIGILAGGIAHDFRNMLTPIIGFADLIKVNVDKNSPVYGYAENIIIAGEKAEALANGLLAFSRKQLLDIKPLIIDELIQNFSKILTRIIGEDIQLKLSLNSGKNIINADLTQIQQVIMNLVTNARDAMPNGGVLKISTEVIEIDEDFIRLHGFGEVGRYVLISVSDTGVGMDKDIQSKIFEPFFTTKPVGKGTGLGLSIVYGIVKQHNGYINVYSEKGHGSAFKIYLPVSVQDSDTDRKKGDYDLKFPEGNGELILVIEDDEFVRDYLVTILEEGNYKVISAENGVVGIKKFNEFKDDIKLVIIDVIMPIKNGKETLEDIKKIRSDVKYLFISGYSSDIIFEKGILIEGIEYLSKPILPIQLLKKVKEILGAN